MRIYDTRLLHFVGDDTTDEVWLGSSQSSHQVVQLFPIGRWYRWETTALLTTSTFRTAAATGITRLSRMVSEDLDQQFITGFLELIHNSVVQRVLVLFQPTRDVVWYLLFKCFYRVRSYYLIIKYIFLSGSLVVKRFSNNFLDEKGRKNERKREREREKNREIFNVH